MSTTNPQADWFPDPAHRHERRYWDGTRWTEHVFSAGVQGIDPLERMPQDADPASDASTSEPTPTESMPLSRREVRERQRREDEVSAPLEVPDFGQIPGAVDAPTDVSVSAPAPLTSATPPVDMPGQVTPAARKISFFGAKKHAEELLSENDRLASLIDRYGLNELAELDAQKAAIQAEIRSAQNDLSNLRAETTRAIAERAAVADEIVDLRNSVQLQEFGLFDFENAAESSVALATELESVRTEIKRLVRTSQATVASSNFVFNNSTAKGRKFVADMSKLLLRAYNAEAENCVKTVKAGNLEAARKRLSTVVTQVERLGTMIDLRITGPYHRLRLKELELTSRHFQALQVEKEMERARREELREQKKAEQELAREKERLQKERSHYLNALAALEAKGDIDGADRLRERLADVDHAIDNVDYRAANIRAGYVYVISNIGAFGPEVVKIGLTRRLDPMDRVNELGDASVPFRFDVHALFFADDAVSIEATLHAHFSAQRLNKVNLRREYFRATPEQVLDALREHNVEVLEYTLDPAAPEYRSSLAVTS
ncbi:DUF4041 domain-containing protein [Microbacterium testaceum]|uniref:Bacteriophage T5 Orf172 DNA-binding domain-containing protein n=2 Tax=Microbacterium TaxID=33882 RepID=A0A147F9N1_MICTE|nr:DUF4041 domain-containing protein [Microbacterium testaceum]KTS13321.1 hypothetical protein RSA3_05235 [Microbacterium testaceum]